MKVCVIGFTGGKVCFGSAFAVILLFMGLSSTNGFADAGLDAFKTGHYQDAFTIWNDKLSQNPDSVGLNYNLAMLFDHGLGTGIDQARAKEHYLKAANKHHAPSMFKIGAMKAKEKNYGQAAMWWLKASHAGLPEAQYNLGILYRDGQGVKKDIAKANYWFKQAAKSAMKKFDMLNSKILSASD